MKRFSLFFRIFFIILLVVLLTSFVFNKSSAQSPKDFAPDEILVKFKEGTPKEIKEKVHRGFASQMKEKIEKLDVEVVKVPKDKVEEFVAKFKGKAEVEYVEPNYVATAFELTNDRGIVDKWQWGMYKAKAANNGLSAWNISKSNSSVKVAILDTGIDQNHEDLQGKIDSNQKNCTDSPTIDDLYGHGTHVAGIAAASTNNGVGVAGLGYNASLMNVKVLGDNGSGYYSWIANCLMWAADNGAKVVNMSLGGSFDSVTLKNAVNYAWGKGVVVVAAAGNSGNASATYPAYYSNVIAVAATDVNDKKASWSSFGKWVDVAAPGVEIYSTFPNHTNTIGQTNYGYASGTSMATPHVAGLAALVWTTSYGGNNADVRRQIEATADKISGTGKYWTYGRINALSAVSTLGTYTNKSKH